MEWFTWTTWICYILLGVDCNWQSTYGHTKIPLAYFIYQLRKTLMPQKWSYLLLHLYYLVLLLTSQYSNLLQNIDHLTTSSSLTSRLDPIFQLMWSIVNNLSTPSCSHSDSTITIRLLWLSRYVLLAHIFFIIFLTKDILITFVVHTTSEVWCWRLFDCLFIVLLMIDVRYCLFFWLDCWFLSEYCWWLLGCEDNLVDSFDKIVC